MSHDKIPAISTESNITLADSRIDIGRPYAGAWIVGGCTHFGVFERPTDEQIKNTENLLGWKWKEI